jgi:hypothetical protein
MKYLTALILLMTLHLPSAAHVCPLDIKKQLCQQHQQMIEEPYRHVVPFNFIIKRNLYVN